MLRYSVYHPEGFYMCDITDANTPTNVPGTDRWGRRLPTFIPNCGPGALSAQKAGAALRDAATSQPGALQEIMLEYAFAIEKHAAGDGLAAQLKLL